MNQQQIDALSVDQLWTGCCLAHFPCKACKGTGVHHSPDDLGGSIGTNSFCQECSGKGPKHGRIWALPGMQGRCRFHKTEKWFWYDKPISQCPRCHGTGYVAKRDLWTLLNTLSEYRLEWREAKLPLAALEHQIESALRRGDEMDFLRVVAQALVAQRCTLGKEKS